METYLVERYLPGMSSLEMLGAAARAESSSAELRAEGVPVQYLGSMFVPGEESCFCQFEASSAEAVAEVNERAKIPYARILPVLHIRAGASEQARAGGLAVR